MYVRLDGHVETGLGIIIGKRMALWGQWKKEFRWQAADAATLGESRPLWKRNKGESAGGR